MYLKRPAEDNPVRTSDLRYDASALRVRPGFLKETGKNCDLPGYVKGTSLFINGRVLGVRKIL